MPLSRATPRKLLHLRDIQLRGYEREDGLVDIEAHLTDVKTYSWGNRDRGGIQSGEPLHEMWLRVTIGRDMIVRHCEASMDATPFHVCLGAAPNVARLVGLNIGKGFVKAALQQLGGVEGCAHLRELLQPVATVAFQTLHSIRDHNPAGTEENTERSGGVPASMLNTCYAYNENGPLVASLAAPDAG